MSDKIHLLITVEPLKDGEELIALCGEKLPQAHAVPLVDMGESVKRSTITFCKLCFGRQYFYAVSSGQTALDASRDVAGFYE